MSNNPPSDDSPASQDVPGPTVVGIGASAGGLAALRTFFSNVSSDSGMSFVVVVHLSPEHESHLADLLQPHVRMPVMQVVETTPLVPNQVYVIPPGANLNSIDTHLRLSPLEEQRRARAPIDHFFRTLAKTHDGKAIGVVLTGTGSDGTLGLREIKEQGGLTIVQDPNEAEYDSMPQSAISSGAADVVLPLAEIPDVILSFVRTQPRLEVLADQVSSDEGDGRQLLQRVFALLRARTGRDFSRYKPATILRRITRRMQFHQVEELPMYLEMLRDQPDEARTLADDLLINVTSFFRDPEVFQILETQVIRQLFDDKGAEENLRVWSVGCATGEEAYSLAILLVEESTRRNQSPRIQVFASELHGKSLEKAREGFYPGDIETDISPERLQRFFHKENGGYRIRKDVRELVVFAPHNILSDPPFSRVDLISCRNLLIYLQRDVQREVFEIFHYSLNSDGYLLLGASETADATELFRIEDKKRCLYRKRNLPRPELRLPVFPLTRAKLGSDPERGEITISEPVSYGALHQRMVEQVAPPSILVSADDKIVHLSIHSGRYLVHPGGELTASVFKLIREELRMEVRAALHQCRETRQPVRTRPIHVQFNGHGQPVSLQVRPAMDAHQDGFALIIFEEWVAPAPTLVPAPADSAEREEMENDLDLTRQHLQAIMEEFETSQEELKASNEELRSTMEELETSKEELQSMNEELQTVNQENRHKVEELSQLSSDLNNLLAASDIATLFLDRQLCILRFTPKVSELFNVRMTDRGRQLSNFTHRLGYDKLDQDARKVLDMLIPIEREVQDETGLWYLARLRPYRSNEDRIEGVVLTFVDITTRRHAEDALRESECNLRELNAALDERIQDQTQELVQNEQRLRAFAVELGRAEQKERRRIATLLHDEVQQLVVAAKMRAGALQAKQQTEEENTQLNTISELMERILTITRTMIADLVPVDLHEQGLLRALEGLVERMRTQHGLVVKLEAQAGAEPADENLRELLFDATRELLLNVVKHAQTNCAWVDVTRKNGEIHLIVRDLGSGVQSKGKNPSSSFGLFQLRERLKPINGVLAIDSEAGEGTRVTVRVKA